MNKNLTDNKESRKQRPIARGVFDYFPQAIAEVANVSYVGNEQHNPGQPMHWSKDKSNDHADCVARHLIERGTIDNDGLRHSAKAAWRALAMLQIEIEADAAHGNMGDPEGGNIENGQYAFEESEALSLKAVLTQKSVDESKLIALGCSPKVAEHIVGGVTYCGVQNAPYVYIAGPMRGYPNFNFPAFDAARDQFVQAGFNVISPADIDRAAGDENSDDQVSFVYRDFYAIFFLKVGTNSNGMIAVLPRFEKSTGTAAEFFLARWLGLPILSAVSGDKLTTMGVCEADLVTAFTDFIKGQ